MRVRPTEALDGSGASSTKPSARSASPMAHGDTLTWVGVGVGVGVGLAPPRVRVRVRVRAQVRVSSARSHVPQRRYPRLAPCVAAVCTAVGAVTVTGPG